MLSTATRPATFPDLFQSNNTSQDFHGLVHSPATSSGSVPLKLMEKFESSLSSMSSYHQVLQKQEPDQDVPSSKRQKRRIGDKAIMEFMQSFRKERGGLDSNPVPQFDSKQVVMNMASTGNQLEGKKSLSSNKALGGHVSSNHYVREENGPKQKGNHECKVCHKSFTSGQALGGHKRVHYDGPPIITKRKAPSVTTFVLPTSQQNFHTPTGCMKLFRDELNQFRDMQEISHSPTGCTKLLGREQLNQLTEINLDLTL